MVQPLCALASSGPSLELVHTLMEMFTRLHLQYVPNPIPPPTPVFRPPRSGVSPRIGLFVDAPDHLSGVCMTLADWQQQARRAGQAMTIHTCSSTPEREDCIQFAPMGSLRMDAYSGLTLQIPRMDDVLRYIDGMACDAIHVSTPGPMGLLGLLAARRRGLPVCGTYHTDFPRYASALTGDPMLENVGWRLMQWFYGQMDRVAAPTESIRRVLIDHGFDPGRLRVVGRGVDASRFNPSHRSSSCREALGPGHSLKLLYVGRLSREKNLETLAHAFRLLTRTRPDVCLILVGEGPYRTELEESLRDLPVSFTGPLSGEDLAAVYASCDLFVFPSKTDTFGRVVLEAQASGLPVVVSDEGGPKDAMRDRQTGLVVPDLNAGILAEAIDQLTNQPEVMARFSKEARRYAESKSLAASFDEFAKLHTFDPINQPAAASEVMA
jgi:glycosyltransferase involved in cell wall biosynthesis